MQTCIKNAKIKHPIHKNYYLNEAIFLKIPAQYNLHCRRGLAVPGCHHFGEKVLHHLHTWKALPHPSAGSPPSPATESYASGTSHSGSSCPTPHHIPTDADREIISTGHWKALPVLPRCMCHTDDVGWIRCAVLPGRRITWSLFILILQGQSNKTSLRLVEIAMLSNPALWLIIPTRGGRPGALMATWGPGLKQASLSPVLASQAYTATLPARA